MEKRERERERERDRVRQRGRTKERTNKQRRLIKQANKNKRQKQTKHKNTWLKQIFKKRSNATAVGPDVAPMVGRSKDQYFIRSQMGPSGSPQAVQDRHGDHRHGHNYVSELR